MEGWLPIVFLGVVLKIPVFAGMYLVWYAIRAEPEVEETPDEGEHGFRRWRREPKPPRGPRRGPHSGGARALPDCPPGARTRVAAHPAAVTASAEHAGRR